MAKRGSVLDAYTAQFGLHRGAWRAAHFAQLVLARVEYGREASAREYAELWGLDMRTAFRHRQEAEEVFGPDWRSVVEQLAKRVERRGELGVTGVLQLAVA